MLSRFGASLGSQSQPWLAPKRLISPDQSPSRRCHPGLAILATTDGFHRRLYAVATFVSENFQSECHWAGNNASAHNGRLLVGKNYSAQRLRPIDRRFGLLIAIFMHQQIIDLNITEL